MLRPGARLSQFVAALISRCLPLASRHGFSGDAATAGLRLCSAPVNYAVLLFPDFSLIVLGYVLCRFTQLNRTVWQAVEALVYLSLIHI